MMNPARTFSSTSLRIRLSDENIDSEAYIQQYLEFTQQKNPVPYNSLLLDQSPKPQTNTEIKEQGELL